MKPSMVFVRPATNNCHIATVAQLADPSFEPRYFVITMTYPIKSDGGLNTEQVYAFMFDLEKQKVIDIMASHRYLRDQCPMPTTEEIIEIIRENL